MRVETELGVWEPAGGLGGGGGAAVSFCPAFLAAFEYEPRKALGGLEFFLDFAVDLFVAAGLSPNLTCCPSFGLGSVAVSKGDFFITAALVLVLGLVGVGVIGTRPHSPVWV